VVKQEERRTRTRSAILEAAHQVFATDGYEATSVDKIAAQAGVAKGAIYHHFSTKAALFEAVLETVSAELQAHTLQATAAATDFWSAAQMGNRAFLTACAEPKTARILLHDGPAVLGWDRWREIDHQNFGGLVRHSFAVAIDNGILAPRDLDKMTKIALGALTEAAFDVAVAENPLECADHYIEIISAMLGGWAVK
jgi:AcrR family transcriptional regulator